MKRTAMAAGLGAATGNFRPGDWICSSCGAHNYASKKFCFKCRSLPAANLELNSAGRGMMGLMGMGGMPAVNMIAQPNLQAYGNLSTNPGLAMPLGRQMGPMSTGMSHLPGQQRVQNVNMRPGDWICTGCGAHNYKDKIVCFRCRGPNLNNLITPQMSNASSFRPGDWFCGGCSAHNYADKKACFKCKRPKPLLQNQPTANPGMATLSPAVQLLLNAAKGIEGLPANFRAGDWICRSCKAHNYHDKTNCFKCKQPKPKNAATESLALGGGIPPNFRVGDWICIFCQAHNFASKTACYKCHKDKGMSGGAANMEKKGVVAVKVAVVGTEEKKSQNQGVGGAFQGTPVAIKSST
ncbi:hypothetical protein AAMO2058_000912000 [Amorphochlora amoebiformis]